MTCLTSGGSCLRVASKAWTLELDLGVNSSQYRTNLPLVVGIYVEQYPWMTLEASLTWTVNLGQPYTFVLVKEACMGKFHTTEGRY